MLFTPLFGVEFILFNYYYLVARAQGAGKCAVRAGNYPFAHFQSAEYLNMLTVL